MSALLNSITSGRIHNRIILVLHMIVLAAAIALIGLITYDTVCNISFLADPFYLECQFWICLLFIADIVIEWILSPHKWHYICTNILFLIVSIPYLNIIEHFNIQLSHEVLYLLRFVPMLRAGYVLMIVLKALSTDKISSMFTAYITLLVATIYFGSLMFFVEEHFVNPGVGTYWSALWWAFMDMTTAGSSINPITSTGKVIGGILSAEGLILFPVFTVYITHAITQRNPTPKPEQPAS